MLPSPAVALPSRWRVQAQASPRCPVYHLRENRADWVRYSWTACGLINQSLQALPHLIKLGYMARKKIIEETFDKTDEKEKLENKAEQLQLFLAFRDIW